MLQLKISLLLLKNTDLVQWISTDGKGEDSRDNMVLKSAIGTSSDFSISGPMIIDSVAITSQLKQSIITGYSSFVNIVRQRTIDFIFESPDKKLIYAHMVFDTPTWDVDSLKIWERTSQNDDVIANFTTEFPNAPKELHTIQKLKRLVSDVVEFVARNKSPQWSFADLSESLYVAGILSNISHSFGATFAATGQSITAFTLCYAVAAPIAAALFSGKPARKVLFVALAIFSIANIVSALATSLSMLLVSRALAGLGAGLFSPMAAAVAAMLVPAEKKGRALGLILGGMSTGTVIGVPIGLLVNNYLGWRYVFIMVTCIGFIGIIGILFKLPDIPVTAPPSLKQRLLVMSNKKITATVGVSFLTAVASLSLYTYISPVISTLLSNGTTLRSG
ncbi:MFS transporter [Piscirickettsia salmonis]|nr:MFS transporter [Piscirickettsia salmonis]QHS25155.1 MFS transporter [Piscirickettsia salmonis]QHS28358.1 MFS transporter [Piscirickettsia salmonis]